MLDWTDRHCRYFLRLISQHSVLYTEMVTTGAIIHGDEERHLGFDDFEHPVALQLGGSNPLDLARCAKIAADRGYDEINLNVGCPSDRVQNGMFGACLMAKPDVVAECVAAMSEVVDIPVTVKHRIGIDDQDSWQALERFVGASVSVGCDTFIVHARKAWLHGLSPKENRSIPPLKYQWVTRLKETFPEQEFILNGGINSIDDAEALAQTFDGVMLGRHVYHDPYQLIQVDQRLYGDEHPIMSRHEIIEAFLPYIEKNLEQGTALKHMTRHILGLFQGQVGARAWRRTLSENAYKPGAGIEVIKAALPPLHYH